MYKEMMNAKLKFGSFGTVFATVMLVLCAAIAPLAQQLQKGVSVQLAPTKNATPMPAADEQNAWIIAITAEGGLFFGSESVTRDGLLNTMIRTPRNRDQNLYIKADARTPYSNVEYALKAAHTVWFDRPILLSQQSSSSEAGTIVPPKGLEVSLESGAIAGPKSIEIEILSAQGTPTLKINGHATEWENLHTNLAKSFSSGEENVVRLKANGTVPFGYVARAIDACTPQARVILNSEAAL